MWQTSIRLSNTHILLQAIQSLSLTFRWQWMAIISRHVPTLNLLIHTIIYCSLPVIHLHADNQFHFHKCCEPNVVVLTMMIAIRSQIKSPITFLFANTPSISLNQPTKMFARFSERIFLSQLLRRLLRIAFLYFFHSTLQFIRYVA